MWTSSSHDYICLSELQLNKANRSETEAPFLDLHLLFLMVVFHPKSMINLIILIL